jgi:membrane associated rhomboid family serine protease
VIISARWPYVTLTLVALNLLIFGATHRQLENERAQFTEIQSHTVFLAATHPATPAATEAEQRLIGTFQSTQPQAWEDLSAPDRTPANKWEAEARNWDPDRAQQEMKGLGEQLDEFQRSAIAARFSLYPLHITAISYLASSFLHRSWAHLIFNLIFLLFAGAALEEVWGWQIFLGFYFVAGAAAVWSYAIVYSGTAIAPMGASGVLAAIMAAFLIRFPRTKMMRGSAIWRVRPRLLRFSSPVYVVFPVWILGELFAGSIVSEAGSLGYWAQGGAFAFGVAVALTMRFTGIDKRLEELNETKDGWTADPHIIKAGEYIEKGRLDFAIAEVKAQIGEKPASVEAHDMLVSLNLRKQDTFGYLTALEARCDLRVKMHMPEAAWQDYVDYCNSGGRRMPSDTWLELCRIAESCESWEQAAREYEQLAQCWPTTKASVVALVAAGRLNAQHGRTEDAKRFYHSAQASSVPHADWDETIRKGLEKVEASAPKTVSASKTKTLTRGPV